MTTSSPRRGTHDNDNPTTSHSARDHDNSLIANDGIPPAGGRFAWANKANFEYGSWRHALGTSCLLVTVVLWTASNFLASTIFADNTYSKPYLVTYINTAFFIIPLLPMTLRELYKDPSKLSDIKQLLHRQPHNYTSLPESESDDSERTPIVKPITNISSSKLTLRETARLSLEFCILWFAANYFVAACLEHTTVASSTILTSTSSIWTLLFGSLISVERFTLRKLLGVVASLVGIALISGIDYSGSTGRDENRGSFPHKSPGELALGNGMAVVSAVLYGVYASLIKKRIGDESRVNVALFFGLVGIYNVILLWPGLVVLHFIGVERFQLPPTRRVTAIILMNSMASLVSDISWALAMLFTSPLLVTVGLSLTIPLSLIGQIVLSGQYTSWIYWVGAFIVLLSFIFINHEEGKEESSSESHY